ncbi:hypothetical protein [Amycolatopsis keratiniphila]|uniref:hypothetical protein n=1 Tax=Amycolatopsis keratiniphila TaxID=129921 RepID=UPI0007AC8EC2|nr:hypothetical protein [Amycolatopsis keratiniphila]
MRLSAAGDLRPAADQQLDREDRLVRGELVRHRCNRSYRRPASAARRRHELTDNFACGLNERPTCCPFRFGCLTSEVADPRGRQRNQVEAYVDRLAEIRPDVAERVGQSLQRIIGAER